MTDRKFFKTVLRVEILSEEPLGEDTDLETVAHQITEGDWSGVCNTMTTTILNGKQAATALRNQGSDPSFFCLTKQGEDVE